MTLYLKHVFIQLKIIYFAEINLFCAHSTHVVFLSDELILFATKHDQNVSAGNTTVHVVGLCNRLVSSLNVILTKFMFQVNCP